MSPQKIESKEKPYQKLLRIEQQLRSGKKYTIAEISNLMQIDSRSVFRYLDRIASTGSKIHNRSRDGRLKEYWIPQEASSVPTELLSALKTMDQSLTQGGVRKYHKLLVEVQSALDPKRNKSQDNSATIPVIDPDFQLDHGPLAEHVSQDSLQHETIDKILQAIRKRNRLSIQYADSSQTGKITKLLFDPYRIYLRVGKLYLLGIKKGSAEIQTLVLKRIKMITTTAENFVRKDLDLDDHFKYCFGQWSPRQETKVAGIRLNVTEPWIIKLFQESHFQPPAKIIPNGDQATVFLKLYSTPDLESWLFGLLPGIEVVEPKELKAKLLKRAQLLSKRLAISE